MTNVEQFRKIAQELGDLYDAKDKDLRTPYAIWQVIV